MLAQVSILRVSGFHHAGILRLLSPPRPCLLSASYHLSSSLLSLGSRKHHSDTGEDQAATPHHRRRCLPARPSREALTGRHREPGAISMPLLDDDCCNRLLQELSATRDNPPTTPESAQPSQANGAATTFTPGTPSPSCGTSSVMTPVFLTRIIRAAIQDTLSSS